LKIVAATLREEFKTVNLSICNIYTPNNLSCQLKFAVTVKELLMSRTSLTNLIIGGDWNVTLEAIDKKGGIQWKPTACRNQIIGLMNELDLVDTLREKNPNKKCYTYEASARNIKSRIDFFLVAKSISHRVSKVDIKTSIAPDHKTVKLCLKLSNSVRGRRLWKFNNALLNDETYVNLIRDSYSGIKEKHTEVTVPKLKWELIKMEIRNLTIPYSKNKARKTPEFENTLEKRLETLDNKINANDNTENVESELKEYEYLKMNLNVSTRKRQKVLSFAPKCDGSRKERNLPSMFSNGKENF